MQLAQQQRPALITDATEDLLHAAPIYDIGKIGIPDSFLKKPVALDAAEWEVMKRHTEIGADSIGEHPDRTLTMAREIALSITKIRWQRLPARRGRRADPAVGMHHGGRRCV